MDTNNRNFKGVWIPREVYLANIPWSAKIIFTEVHSFTETGGSCFMSNDYLAKFIGISSTQVSRHVSLLIEIGWIKQTSFDGRQRHLQSLLIDGFTPSDVMADLIKSARLDTQKAQASLHKKRKYNNTTNNTITKPTTFLKNEYSFFVELWFTEYEKVYKTKPAFGEIDGKKLKSILKKLEAKIKVSGDLALEVFEPAKARPLFLRFLELAHADKWLHNNFELSNLDSKFNTIIQKNGATNNKASIEPTRNPFTTGGNQPATGGATA